MRWPCRQTLSNINNPDLQKIRRKDIFVIFLFLAQPERDRLTNLGYKVEWATDVTGASIKETLESYTAPDSKSLERYSFYGHGDPGNAAINTDGTPAGTEGVVAGKYTHYGLSTMSLHACGSLTPTNNALGYQTTAGGFAQLPTRGTPKLNSLWRLNVSPQGTLYGYNIGAVSNETEANSFTSMPGLHLNDAAP